MTIRSTAVLTAFLALLGALAFPACSEEDGDEHAQQGPPPRLRTYFIAADEVAWDYAPLGINGIAGAAFGAAENVFVESGPDRIGRQYMKALYREYADATFTTLKTLDPKWEHLGTVGPVIRAVVGDTVDVVFKNNTAYPRTIHVHGLEYDKSSEGTYYDDGTSASEHDDDDVAPGNTHSYHYRVPERAGPGPNDGSSVMWMYHSHVDEPVDVNAGLLGPIIVTRRDMARPDGTPVDMDREFVLLFEVMDENKSNYLQDNIQAYCGNPGSVDPDDPDFQESNLMHAINGYVYGNLRGLNMTAGERVRWYVMGLGTEVDLHTAHWHGQTVIVNMMRTDIVSLLPGGMAIADMEPDNEGTWLMHCHVNDHIDAGMLALFEVTAP
ncbi:MAG: multicopper oxidase domain-containing protein [Planctomycetes bacterium]|nr:multicopper oxidase domain-containing protein [Planctomycetota bacterium]